MKAKFFAAIFFAALATVSCKWFTHEKSKQHETALLAGRYEVIGISDSSAEWNDARVNTTSSFFMSLSNDTLKRYLDFAKDSILACEAADKVDSTKYYADSAKEIVYIKTGSLYRSFYIRRSDSLVDLLAENDSVHIALRKL